MANTGEVWLIADGEDAIAAPTPQNSENLYRPEVLETIEVESVWTRNGCGLIVGTGIHRRNQL